MNASAKMMMQYAGQADYGWVITRSYDPFFDGVLGRSGPLNTTTRVQAELDAIVAKVAQKNSAPDKGWERHHFTMFDDDGNRMVAGYIVVAAEAAEAVDWEQVTNAPLTDFGESLGATKVTFHGHPEWTIG